MRFLVHRVWREGSFTSEYRTRDEAETAYARMRDDPETLYLQFIKGHHVIMQFVRKDSHGAIFEIGQ